MSRKPAKRVSAEVIPFPLSKRDGLLRADIETLLSLDYDDGRAFWQRRVRELREELKAAGARARAVNGALAQYKVAVTNAMFALPPQRYGGPGDAA